jgi:hypothetical protein
VTVITLVPALAGRDHYWNRMGLHGEWWVADESPGGLGGREVWVDESAIDMIARGDCDPAIVLRQADGTAPVNWIGAIVRVNRHPGLDVPVVYKIHCRRWSQANDGRPYYVLAWPDLPFRNERGVPWPRPRPNPPRRAGEKTRTGLPSGRASRCRKT